MAINHLSPLLLLALLPLAAAANKLSFSPDGGTNWLPADAADTTDLPSHVLLRTSAATHAPTLYVPRCAVEPGLHVSVVRLTSGGAPVGLRWVRAAGCEPAAAQGEQQSPRKRVVVTEKVAKRLRPDWFEHVRRSVQAEGDGGAGGVGGNARREKGFFGKYGFYIMGFIGVALAHGIRKGMAELREEMEREEAEKLKAKQRKPTGQVRVVVPKRKAGKGKRKAPASAGTRSSSSGGK